MSGPLLPLKPSGHWRPLYIVHPVGGDPACYAHLAEHLDAEQPLFGLRSMGLASDESPIPTVEAMATAYLKAVRAHQPEGPYLLAGWSLGGIVAFEMAQQLDRQGIRSELLMLDCFAPSPTMGARRIFGDFNDKTMCRVLITDLILRSDRNLVFPTNEEFDAHSGDELLDYTFGRARELELIPPSEDRAQFMRRYDVYKSNNRALIDYLPQPFANRATLFRGRQAHVLHALPPTSGWERHVPSLQTRWVPGNHFTIGHPAHARGVAEHVTSWVFEVTEAFK